ncbi:sulfite exporter TauE/SafE family protein [Candidatus Poribacteria bacterium]|nr:sulfite exporter TauE/SafE family protein [Candidatus Poribacteria bacterium]
MDISKIYLSTAFLLGMLHTLEPGHGKSVIAAYLVGTSGRTLDAVILGLITAFTHTFSVIVLGVIFKFVSEKAFVGPVQTSFRLIAGLMILGVGIWVLYGGIKGRYHSHPHIHHDHDHPHGYRYPQLILMGFSAGMVPCPAGIAVLLSAISSGQINRGLILVLIFSLGVAFTITTIAITAANVGRIAEMTIGGRFNRFFMKLPIISGIIISLLGLYSLLRLVV